VAEREAGLALVRDPQRRHLGRNRAKADGKLFQRTFRAVLCPHGVDGKESDEQENGNQ
jgi:hypothetical protein